MMGNKSFSSNRSIPAAKRSISVGLPVHPPELVFFLAPKSSESSFRFFSSIPGTGPVSERIFKNAAEGFLNVYHHISKLQKTAGKGFMGGVPICEETRILILENSSHESTLSVPPSRHNVM